MIVASQDGLVQTQGKKGIHQGPAQVDVADLDDRLSFAFTLTNARVITTTHQATATEDLGGAGIVGGITDGRGQGGDLDIAESFDSGPYVVGSLGQQGAQAVFQLGDMAFDLIQQRQVVGQQFAANGDQFGIRQQRFPGVGDDLGGCDAAHGIMLSVEGVHQVLGRHSDQLARVRAHPDQMLHGLTRPESGGKQGPVALFGLIGDDDQTWEDTVQVADDLVLQGGADLDLAESNTIQVLQLQIDPLGWSERGAFSPPQQVADGGGVDFVALFVVHHLLIPILLDSIAVDQCHRPRLSVQLSRQVLKVMTAGFHADQHHLRLRPVGGFINGLTQLVEAALKDVNLKRGDHDLPQRAVDHHRVKVLVNIQGDAQDTIQRHASNPVGECLSALSAQVSPSFSAHDWYLLELGVPVGETKAGQHSSASPVFFNGLRTLTVTGRRYSIGGGGDVNHLQNL